MEKLRYVRVLFDEELTRMRSKIPFGSFNAPVLKEETKLMKQALNLIGHLA
jgi:hypothetical protein